MSEGRAWMGFPAPLQIAREQISSRLDLSARSGFVNASSWRGALSTHWAGAECVWMRDAAATVTLLEIAPRHLDAQPTGAHMSAPGPAKGRKVWGDPMTAAACASASPG